MSSSTSISKRAAFIFATVLTLAAVITNLIISTEIVGKAIKSAKVPNEDQLLTKEFAQQEKTEKARGNFTSKINTERVGKTIKPAKLPNEEQQLAKGHNQEQANKARSNATISTLIVQCGRQRTATTDQAMAMCAAAQLAAATPVGERNLTLGIRRMSDPYEVPCLFMGRKGLAASELWPPGWPPRSNHTGTAGQLIVYKTHDLARCRRMIETAEAAGSPGELGWNFLAVGSVDDEVDKNPLMETFKSERYFAEGFPYLQDRVQHAYAPLLNLGPTETAELIEYLKVWVVLRRCCGHQMSQGFSKELKELHTRNTTGISDGLKRHACYKVDVVAVERQLLSLPLVHRYPQLLHLQFPLPGVAGLMLNGLICVRHRLLAGLGLDFNSINWRQVDPGAKDAIDAYYRVDIDEALASMARYRLLVGLPPDPQPASQLWVLT